MWEESIMDMLVIRDAMEGICVKSLRKQSSENITVCVLVNDFKDSMLDWLYDKNPFMEFIKV